MGISIGQLLIILAIVALLFGTKKLRNLGGDLGSALKSFRSAVKDDGEHENAASDDTPGKGKVIEGETGPDTKSSDNKS